MNTTTTTTNTNTSTIMREKTAHIIVMAFLLIFAGSFVFSNVVQHAQNAQIENAVREQRALDGLANLYAHLSFRSIDACYESIMVWSDLVEFSSVDSGSMCQLDDHGRFYVNANLTLRNGASLINGSF